MSIFLEIAVNGKINVNILDVAYQCQFQWQYFQKPQFNWKLSIKLPFLINYIDIFVNYNKEHTCQWQFQWQFFSLFNVNGKINVNFFGECISMAMSISIVTIAFSQYQLFVNQWTCRLININGNVNFPKFTLSIINGNFNSAKKSISMAPSILLLMSEIWCFLQFKKIGHLS